MKRKRRLLLLGSAAAVAGAGNAAPAAPGPATLSLWTMQLSPFHDAYVHGVIDSFRRAHSGVVVKWVDVPWAEMERKVLASMAAGTAPDVVNLNPQFAARLAEFGALADPRRYLQPADIEAYLPAAWSANRLGGVPFAVPWYLSTTVTLFNRAALGRAGVGGAPRDYAELLHVARAVRENTGGYAWFPAMDGAAPLETLVAMNGPLLKPDGCRAGFEGPGGVAVFEHHRELYQRRWVPPTVLTEGHRAAVAQFLAGQVAMVPTGMQFLAQVKTNNPALYAQIGVAPQLAGYAGSKPNIAAMNLAVPGTSRHPALAFALAQHVTNPVNQIELARRVPLLPSSRASYDDALFRAKSGDALLDRARELSVQQVWAGEVAVPPLRGYHKLRTSYVRGLHAAMAGRSTPQAAVDEVSHTWAQVLACRAAA